MKLLNTSVLCPYSHCISLHQPSPLLPLWRLSFRRIISVGITISVLRSRSKVGEFKVIRHSYASVTYITVVRVKFRRARRVIQSAETNSDLSLRFLRLRGWWGRRWFPGLRRHLVLQVVVALKTTCETKRRQKATERRGSVVNTPASYTGDPKFKARPGDRLSNWGFSCFFSVPPGECRDSTLKLGYNRFFQILYNSSSVTYHHIDAMEYSYWKKRRKITKLSRKPQSASCIAKLHYILSSLCV
jgi:hypothetical protein